MSNERDIAVKGNIDIVNKWQELRLEAILFCDSCDVTKDDKTTLTGIFDRIYVHPEVKQTPPFQIFTRTVNTSESLVQITGYAPNGAVVTVAYFLRVPVSEFTPDLPANVHNLAYIGSFHVPVEGIYWFDVSFDNQSVGGAALVIEFRETEDKTGGTDTYV